MDTIPGLRPLLVRKRDLLLQSELNRQILRVEAGRLSLRAQQFQRGYSWVRSAWQWAAPVAGILLARKFNQNKSAFAKGTMIFSGLRSVWKVWAALRGKRSQPAPEN